MKTTGRKDNRRRWRCWSACVTFVLAVCMLSSCTDTPVMPSAGGRPYEIVLVGDDSLVVDSITSILSEPVQGLPQYEPCFDVKKVTERQFRKTDYRLYRCIIRLCIDSVRYDRPMIMQRVNVYAGHQTVIDYCAPSAQRLLASVERYKPQLVRLCNYNAMRTILQHLQSKRATESEALVKRTFGIEMMLPADMRSSKKGDGFLWLSNNANTGMQNVCVYKIPLPSVKRSLGARQIIRQFAEARDAVMQRNLPGETDSMYMSTVAQSCTVSDSLLVRGLWEMRGDAMGGPFVARIYPMGDSALVVEGFVYAPEKKKRNLIRQMDAVIYTVKLKK